MDIRVFNELKNKGYITNPFLSADAVNDFDELITKGYASGIGVKELYNSILNSTNDSILELANSETKIDNEETIININDNDKNIIVDIINEEVKDIKEDIVSDNTESINTESINEDIKEDIKEDIVLDNTESINEDNVIVEKQQYEKKTVKKTKKIE